MHLVGYFHNYVTIHGFTKVKFLNSTAEITAILCVTVVLYCTSVRFKHCCTDSEDEGVPPKHVVLNEKLYFHLYIGRCGVRGFTNEQRSISTKYFTHFKYVLTL